MGAGNPPARIPPPRRLVSSPRLMFSLLQETASDLFWGLPSLVPEHFHFYFLDLALIAVKLSSCHQDSLTDVSCVVITIMDSSLWESDKEAGV